MKLSTLIISSIFYLGISCDDSKKNDSGSKSAAQTDTLDGFGKLTGTLMVSTADGEQPAAGATVQVESHPEYAISADENGEFEINNISPGVLTVYAETSVDQTTLLKLAGGIDTNKRAAQFKDILVSSSGDTELSSEAKLDIPGSISGEVALINNPENVSLVGIKAYIPGTSFAATVDEQGKFILSNIPSGVYDTLRFDQDGLSSSELQDITVASGENKDAGIVYMSLSTGPSGEIIGLDKASPVDINGESKIVLQASSIKVNLRYDSRATLMKISHESSFINTDWMPIATSYQFTAKNNSAALSHYSTDGNKSIFVKFTDRDGLESSVYQMDFIIDRSGPSVTNFSLVHGWDQVASTALGMHLTVDATDNGTGIKEMMICNSDNFPACGSWESYSLNRTGWPVSASVFVKLKDHVGHESTAAQDTILTGSHTTIAGGTFLSSFLLPKSMSPYSFDADLTFEKNLTIEAGTTLDHASGVGYRKIIVEGRLLAQGTLAAPIVITASNNAFSGFDLSSSTVSDNVISYLSIGSNVIVPAGSFISIDGGKVENSTVVMDSFQTTNIEKNGYKALTISGNTFTGVKIKVTQGSATTITKNSFVGSNYHSIIRLTGGTGTSITFNTINASSNAASTPTNCLEIEAGDASLTHNDISYESTDTGTGTGLAVSGGGTVTANYNNWNITNGSGSPDNLVHIANTASAVNADFNYYTGHSTTNPLNTGMVTSTNDQMAPWPTAPSANCAGSGC